MEPASPAGPENDFLKAICGLCPQDCRVRVRLEDGTIRWVAADPHPQYGNLCERGRLAPEIVYSPDRVRTPLACARHSTVEEKTP